MAEGMTVTELADAVGMTPRNIRAHQSQGPAVPAARSAAGWPCTAAPTWRGSS